MHELIVKVSGFAKVPYGHVFSLTTKCPICDKEIHITPKEDYCKCKKCKIKFFLFLESNKTKDLYRIKLYRDIEEVEQGGWGMRLNSDFFPLIFTYCPICNNEMSIWHRCRMCECGKCKTNFWQWLKEVENE